MIKVMMRFPQPSCACIHACGALLAAGTKDSDASNCLQMSMKLLPKYCL